VTPEERKERIAKAQWLSEVIADTRFQSTVDTVKQDLSDSLKDAEAELIELTLKGEEASQTKDKVLRLRYGANVLDLLLSQIQSDIGEGKMQAVYLDQMEE
jgi:hypothetical protein